MASRFLENMSFGLTAALVALISRRPDVIYANTWPIVATGLAALAAGLRGIPLVISIQDVYPESLMTQERLSPASVLVLGMRWIDGAVARASKAVIAVSEQFARVYRESRQVPAARVHVVPNWLDGKSIDIAQQSDGFRRQLGIPQDAFLLAYGGNIGIAAGVETVIESFRHLPSEERVHLLIAGEGGALAECQSLANRVSGSRITFYSPWPVEESSILLRAADALVLPTRGNQSLVSVPSKLISYMLAARPVIALARSESETTQTILQSGCGWIVEPDQPESLAAKIREIIALEARQLARRGDAGRRFALRNLVRETCLPAVIEILENAGSGGPYSES